MHSFYSRPIVLFDCLHCPLLQIWTDELWTHNCFISVTVCLYPAGRLVRPYVRCSSCMTLTRPRWPPPAGMVSWKATSSPTSRRISWRRSRPRPVRDPQLMSWPRTLSGRSRMAARTGSDSGGYVIFPPSLQRSVMTREKELDPMTHSARFIPIILQLPLTGNLTFLACPYVQYVLCVCSAGPGQCLPARRRRRRRPRRRPRRRFWCRLHRHPALQHA